jgi:hypothetical protein
MPHHDHEIEVFDARTGVYLWGRRSYRIRPERPQRTRYAGGRVRRDRLAPYAGLTPGATSVDAAVQTIAAAGPAAVPAEDQSW